MDVDDVAGDEREHPPYGRRRALVALALALPILVIVLLVTGGDGGDDDTADTSAPAEVVMTAAPPLATPGVSAASEQTPPSTAPLTTTAPPSTAPATTTPPPTSTPAATTTGEPGTTREPDTTSTLPVDRSVIDVVGGPAWLVNRDRPLPDGYVPQELVVPAVPLKPGGSFTQLTPATAAAFEDMAAAARDAGFELQLNSAYRSFADQQQLYAVYERDYGSETAAQLVAVPGTSEHQTGLAADVGLVGLPQDETFGSTPAATWVAEHSYRFGLIVRYPPDKSHITGYANEPWHLRYVGVELAAQLHASGQTMEEHFGLAPT